MRYQGKIKNWKGDKGYGFVSPNGDTDTSFVHISQFKNKHRRPKDDDLITYEIEIGSDGKKKATQIRFSDEKNTNPKTDSSETSIVTIIILIAIVLAGSWFAYNHYQSYRKRIELSNMAPEAIVTTLPTKISSSFTCDGRVHCSEMRSCEEAQFFVNNCPGTKMDGDHDGKACEERCGY